MFFDLFITVTVLIMHLNLNKDVIIFVHYTLLGNTITNDVLCSATD